MISAVAELQERITPFIGQDCQLVYRVRTNRHMNIDAIITGWTLVWALVTSATAGSATLTKTTGAGITIATPYATVTLPAADMATLTAGTTYRMQLWRNESGNLYPLTGLGTFVPQAKPPLS